MDLSALEKTLRESCAVSASDLLVLGFSGGPDSLALLHALHALGQPLLAAHLDHSLRTESASEAETARKQADTLGVPFISERVDVAAAAAARKQGIEEAAREARYGFLFRMAAEQSAKAVAVAHNADDQVETVVMHLLRGTGPTGLRGMAARLLPNPWSKQMPLVRPLLGIPRLAIESYCAANDLHPTRDASNQETTYFRNRLRHELLPLLDSFAPGFRERLSQTAALLSADQDLLEQLGQQAWRRCLSLLAADHLSLDRAALRAEPLTLQRAVVRRAFAALRPNVRDLDFATVERALPLASTSTNTASVDWLAGLFLLAEGEDLWVADWAGDLPVKWPQAPEAPVHFEAPAEIPLGHGWRITAQIRLGSHDEEKGDEGFEAHLDLQQTGEELTLRRRQPGDRFQPLGMDGGSMKLSDFMINEKVPSRARDAWPLLCKGEAIVWVPGYRLAHPYRIQPGTRKVLRVQLARSR